MASDVPMSGDGQPKMPKMKPQTSSGSTGSGSTMIDTSALHNRLAQLQAMQASVIIIIVHLSLFYILTYHHIKST